MYAIKNANPDMRKPPAKVRRQVRACSGFALGMLFAATAAIPAYAMNFETALAVALERAPSLQAKASAVQGALALQTSAGQLPDPVLMLGLDSLPVNGPNRGSLTRDDFTQRKIGWSQDMLNRAKRNARSDAAAARTERDRALLQSERLLVRREAGLAWLSWYFAEQKLAQFNATLSHHRLLEETSLSQLSAGKIMPSDVSMVRLEALALADRRDELLRDVEQSRIAVRRWIGETAASISPLNESVGQLPPEFDVNAAYLKTNLERNPDIAALTPMRAMAEAEVSEAEAAKRGDWSWGVSYGKRGQGYGDLVSVQLNFEIPTSPAQRQEPQIFARLKELERIDADKSELLRKQTQELETQLSELTELDSKLKRLQQQALPVAAAKTAFTLAAYQGGRDKLASVLEARKQQTELDLRALDLQAKKRAVQWRLKSIIPE